MRIRVDEEVCQGHTQCNAVAPDLFGLRDSDGHAFTLLTEVPTESHELARLAAASCPEHAILVEDDA